MSAIHWLYAIMPVCLGMTWVLFSYISLSSIINECSGSYDIDWRCHIGHRATLYWALEFDQAGEGMEMYPFYRHPLTLSSVPRRQVSIMSLRSCQLSAHLIQRTFVVLALPHEPEYAPNEPIARALQPIAIHLIHLILLRSSSLRTMGQIRA